MHLFINKFCFVLVFLIKIDVFHRTSKICQAQLWEFCFETCPEPWLKLLKCFLYMYTYYTVQFWDWTWDITTGRLQTSLQVTIKCTEFHLPHIFYGFFLAWNMHSTASEVATNLKVGQIVESIQGICKCPTYRFEDTIVWERWHFWRSEINIDYHLIQCIRGFCSYLPCPSSNLVYRPLEST